MKRFFGISGMLVVSMAAAMYFALMVSGQNSFYMQAAQANMAEIELSRVALQKSQNESVRQFAQQMIDDHTAAGEKLSQLAASKSITLPTGLDNKHRSATDKLNRTSSDKFDRDFMKQMVKDHEATVKLFEREAGSRDDADTKAFASETLPTLRSHLEMARSMSSGNMNSNMNRGNMNMNSNRNRNTNSNSDMNMNSNNNSDMNMNSNSNSDMNMNSNSKFGYEYEFKFRYEYESRQYEYEFNGNRNTNRNSNSNRNRNSNSNSNSNSNTNSNSNDNKR